MMRARVGIDLSKSWADQVEEGGGGGGQGEARPLQRRRSRDDDALIDELQQRLQKESGAKQKTKEEYIKAAVALARDPAFVRDPKLKKDEAWWASYSVPDGRARTSARKNATIIVQKGWLVEGA